ncbi:lipase/acyltransferase domain-containing protein [Rhodocaloribacter litoris]|uniref:lipase/acyltransferase domain-containing protein n=1 Tax=Rhodocaloribacter litoris TaxID=2558931 RepID=UPI00311AA25E
MSRGYGVSADGSWVVGVSSVNDDYFHAFRWSSATGMQDLGSLPGRYWTEATAVSADGAVVVGSSGTGSSRHAFVWTPSTGMQDLGTLGGDQSVATDVSDDGSVVVGLSQLADGTYRAFRWTEATGMVQLNTPGSSSSIGSIGISPDGSTIIVWGQNQSGAFRNLVWTAETGVLDLDSLIVHHYGFSDWLSTIFAFGVRDFTLTDNRLILTGGYSEARRLVLEPWPLPAACPVLTVTASSDEPDADPGDGLCDTDLATEGLQCTLRAALEEANTQPGRQCIHFNLPSGEAPVIPLTAPLPAITDSLTIDGTTQPGDGRVHVDGLTAGTLADGLVVAGADSVVVRGLALYGFDGVGIRLEGGRGHLVENTYLGFDGTAYRPNGLGGITVSGGAEEVTLGSLEEAHINHIYDGLNVEGETTRRVRVLRNRLHVPPDFMNDEILFLPLDLGNDGPSCFDWAGPEPGRPNDAMPSPRVLALTEGAVEGMTVPGATVIVYTADSTGTGLSRYWPRVLTPVAHGEADAEGLFHIAVDLAPGTEVSLVAVDPEGNTSEPTQLRRPVIFIPGIGGTWLRMDGENYWLPPVWATSDEKNLRMGALAMQNDGRTSLNPLVANEVIESVLTARKVYGPIHDHLEAAGYPGHPLNLNEATLDQWRFPNDWRRSVDELADHLWTLVDQITTDSGPGQGRARACQVDLVAHSNGGLIASVYVRRDSSHARNRVHRLITSGTPYLGATQAVAAHTRGYIFEVDEELVFGLNWEVAWGDMVQMVRNIPGAYGLLPSRAYYEAVDPSSLSHAHGYSTVDLYNEPLGGYDATFDFMTRAKTDDLGIPFGLARNAALWDEQQEFVHDLVDDWRTYDGPPQIFRQVGLLIGETETGWFMGPGPEFIPAGATVRSEPGDTDRHRAYRERLVPVWGLGDRTVPLVSATLGHDPRVGDTDFSGVDESRWIEAFEYYACAHGKLVEPGCMPENGSGPEALDRIVQILQSGYRVPEPPAAGKRVARASTEPLREAFYVQATAPVQVLIEDAAGRKTGVSDPALPGAIEYGIPGVAFNASRFGAGFTLPADSAYTITVTVTDSTARVYLHRQAMTMDAVAHRLFPDQTVAPGGRLVFTLQAGGTGEGEPWQVDADGDGTFEATVAPAALLAGSAAVPALPIPQPAGFDVPVPLEGDPVVRTLRLPDTGTDGWQFALSEAAPWLHLSAASGTVPAEVTLTFDPQGLGEGVFETTLSVQLTQGDYATSLPVPVRMQVEGTALPVELVALSATADGPDVLLRWTTASETNNAGFEVQHFHDTWQTLAFVEGHGTTAGTHAYTYRIAGLDPGTHRFRLKQVDVDGTFTYSTEAEVTVGVPGVYVLSAAYPNPFREAATLRLAVARPQRVQVAVYDVLGRRVALLHAGPLAGGETHTFRFDGSGLPGGLYLIRVEGERFRATRAVTLLR